MAKKKILGKIDIQQLISTRDFLHQALYEAESKLEIAGTIQAFEVCYELAWKTLKKVLNLRGIDVFSPRETFRLAAREALIANPKNWFDYVEKRNITVHSYEDEIMKVVYPVLPKFLKDLNSLIKNLEKL
ncbi:HI0074 family nucleotidyltransferase substrate-binding subunit [endosymbiont GvMRE of Glomus versiforme]|uniref:HI0074 family nucleotidyltransferase substrate-binding subunit n=1 Tax=endosymbiont GvMRE of Glomus versiforme TaxID=2039283 RepID=UPI000ECF1350|nr:HI0074 family nucleotidyltransferase substrate-binding subunit [endosymbiont GvMRE of Glomus versiforme]RHZ35259.1 Nucleotidyltransferase substrate binding protein [endosymbiont GvMRE of Glomus versiforme]